jgi:hypothetical protein
MYLVYFFYTTYNHYEKKLNKGYGLMIVIIEYSSHYTIIWTLTDYLGATTDKDDCIITIF